MTDHEQPTGDARSAHRQAILRLIRAKAILDASSAERLGKMAGVEPDKVRRIFRALASVVRFEEDGEGAVATIPADGLDTLEQVSLPDPLAVAKRTRSDPPEAPEQPHARRHTIHSLEQAAEMLDAVESYGLDDVDRQNTLLAVKDALSVAKADLSELRSRGSDKLIEAHSLLTILNSRFLDLLIEGGDDHLRISNYSGIVLRGNVIGFSALATDQQQSVISAMRDRAEQHWSGFGNTSIVIIDDTIIIAIPESDFLAFQRSFDFALEWRKTLEPIAALRITIHYGDFSLRVQNGIRSIGGPAIKLSARLAVLANSYWSVVSDEFVEAWASRSALPLTGTRKLFPPDNSIEVFLDSSVLQRFRLLRLVGEDGNVNLSSLAKTPYLPDEVAHLVQLDNAIRDKLADIEHAFVQQIQEESGLTPAGLSTRVSIFAPLEGLLRCSAYRYHRDNRDIRKPSNTAYPLDQRGGIFADSYSSGETHCVRGLPLNREEYEKELERLAGIDRTVSNKFTRCGRAIIVVPLRGPIRDVQAVVCIDTMDPLESVSDSRLRASAAAIQHIYGTQLAWLWELRSRTIAGPPRAPDAASREGTMVGLPVRTNLSGRGNRRPGKVESAWYLDMMHRRFEEHRRTGQFAEHRRTGQQTHTAAIIDSLQARGDVMDGRMFSPTTSDVLAYQHLSTD